MGQVTPPLIERRTIMSGDAPLLMSRLMDQTGAYVTNASMAGGTITARIFDLRSSVPRTAIATISLTIASVLYDTIQNPIVPTGNPPVWSKDTTGFNFSWQLPATYTELTTQGSGELRVEIWCTPASGQPFRAGVWQLTILEAMTYA